MHTEIDIFKPVMANSQKYESILDTLFPFS